MADSDDIFFAVTFSVGFLVGALLVGSLTESNAKYGAIKAQVAEWRINPFSGEKTFVYLTPAPVPAPPQPEK